MRRWKLLSAVIVMCGFAAITLPAPTMAAELALPDVHTALSGENYPIRVSGEVKVIERSQLRLVDSVSSLSATLMSVLLEAKELSSLGIIHLDYTGASEGTSGTGAECKTAGDAAGVLLFEEVGHLVFDLFSPRLELAGLLLSGTVLIVCGTSEEIEVRGPVLVRVVPISNSSEGGDSTKAEARAVCQSGSNGIQEISSYYNNNGTMLTRQLMELSLAGGEFVDACGLAPTVLLEVEASSVAKMFTVLY